MDSSVLSMLDKESFVSNLISQVEAMSKRPHIDEGLGRVICGK